MKGTQLYLVGYFIVVAGLLAALWKLGVVERVGPAWMVIGSVIAVGIGVMISVKGGGDKKTIEIDQKS